MLAGKTLTVPLTENRPESESAEAALPESSGEEDIL